MAGGERGFGAAFRATYTGPPPSARGSLSDELQHSARVVVTGMGALTPLGLDVATTWEAMVAGRSGVGPITQFDPSRLTTRIAAEVKGFDASSVLDRKDQRRNDRYVQFALVATVRRWIRPDYRRTWTAKRPSGPA